MLQLQNITKMVEAEVRPKLSELFYTTTVCVRRVYLDNIYYHSHRFDNNILPQTLLQSRRHTVSYTHLTLPTT